MISLPLRFLGFPTIVVNQVVLLSIFIVSTTTALTLFTDETMGSIYGDVSLTTVEMLRRSGYTVECHSITTEDGYVLELHRIPKSKSGKLPFRNYPIFVQHGILGSSADWVLGGADVSIATQLADQGYDLWLGNARGNTYSRKHVSLNPKSKEYWDFSLDEMGLFDLPAVIDHILLITKKEQLHYLGYSMGTAIFYIMSSEKPEYQSKIRSQISLAPVAYLSNTKSILKYVAPHVQQIKFLIKYMSNGAFLPESEMSKLIAETFCRAPYLQKEALIPLIFGHFPAGTSTKLVEHFAQIILSGDFRKFDYGPTNNLKMYNCTTPPSFKLNTINVPITMMWADNDILADKIDVFKLRDKLPNVIDCIKVDSPWCNHIDYMWSKKVNVLINDPVIAIFNKTDSSEWKNSRPEVSEQDEYETNDFTESICLSRNGSIVSDSGHYNIKNVPSLDFLLSNLDTIIGKAMPHIEGVSKRAIEYEKELQKIAVGNLINLEKASEKKTYELLNTMNTNVQLVDRAVKDSTIKSHHFVETNIKMVSTNIHREVDRVEKTVIEKYTKTEEFVGRGFTMANIAVHTKINELNQTMSNVFRKFRTLLMIK
ncbi:lipase 3-like isoform X2 [Adelges cooleyi]|uniref:lipase 3-like isoform X2 n=1 Tax=Adelges cooleyi TaxID=133065 RepID=UPI00217FF3BF|nr:lipase 3-like isoform X2 [Adelges cooleyi]